ncbi:hypothetical protein BCR33DRAFT_717521 [Rhizoclosmatium globosum]|uniref:Uncharacterized protein n=1 Tax=Rhizoclosmatium globosum TaxID=329046 RepID=A0A1Y2C8T6_9FUNG|nr:hypothetical protein BCR33DRAFT_717521 [Rhizoclosmatium globosum]|eukprot:ORY43274.1 hypothetical protein BCR33DRAFT_717521 [Rhizoclosmatium globosum]
MFSPSVIASMIHKNQMFARKNTWSSYPYGLRAQRVGTNNSNSSTKSNKSLLSKRFGRF